MIALLTYMSGYSPTEEPPSWARVASLENYAMTLGKDDEARTGDGEGKGEERYKVVAAAKTTRMEIVS